jgi:thioredoxin reductase
MENGNNAGGANHSDYLIIGAGPAGLQLGYYLQKAGHDYRILEAGQSAGTFFDKFPRHRTLISSNKVFTGSDDAEINMRFDWNSLLADDDEGLLFKDYTKTYFPPADELVRYLKDWAARYQLNIRYGVRAARISRDELFRVEDTEGNVYTAKRLIIATGFSKPYLPPIPGIELTENYTEVSVDPEEFVNQKVLIIGKGNSAFETADNLIPTAAVIHMASPNPLNLAWKTHFVGHLRAVNNNFLDTYQLKSQNAIIDATIEKIERRDDGKYVVSFSYTHADDEREDLIYDRVIAATGFRLDDSIFDETARPALMINDRFPSLTSEWESANVRDMYFAGTLTQVRDFKKTTSGFIHGFRYNVRALYRMLEQKYHGHAWPSQTLEATTDSVLDAIIRRVNKSSALWQQFGFLCDLIVMPEGGGAPARYYEELPVDYVHDTELGENRHYYIVTLEFGKVTGDPFNIVRHPTPSEAEKSVFLHPVVRRFDGARLVAEHHLLEDLYGEWIKPDMHINPLREFIAGTMRRDEPLRPSATLEQAAL